MSSDNTEIVLDVITFDSTNETNIIYMNRDINVVHKYYAPSLSSNHKKATGTEFESEKRRVCCHKNAILGLL